MNSQKPIWKRRLSIIEMIYSHLIFSSLNIENHSDFFKKEDWTDFEENIFSNYLKNKDDYSHRFSSLLRKDWTLDRLNMVILCILYEAASEFYVNKTPAAVLIEQSIKTAKNYCEASEYKLVHAILENFLNNKNIDGKVNN